MAVTDFLYSYALTKNSVKGVVTYTIGAQSGGTYDFVDPDGTPKVLETATSLAVTISGFGSNFSYVGEYSVGGVTGVVMHTSGNKFYLFTNTGGQTGTFGATAANHAICFLAGTRIATPTGERSIESLQIGDMINLADGSQKPVKWLGKMTAPLNRFNRHIATPILIRAGALGNGLPRRDLYTSYRHAFELEGVIVIAGLLVNGTSIIQCSDWPEDSVLYYQVEVEGHELMLAEGAASETFGEDGDNRDGFDNAAEFRALYPDAVPAEPMPLGRVILARQIPRSVKARIEAAAVETGYLKPDKLSLRA